MQTDEHALRPSPIIQGQHLAPVGNPLSEAPKDVIASSRSFPHCECGRPECKPDDTVEL